MTVSCTLGSLPDVACRVEWRAYKALAGTPDFAPFKLTMSIAKMKVDLVSQHGISLEVHL